MYTIIAEGLSTQPLNHNDNSKRTIRLFFEPKDLEDSENPIFQKIDQNRRLCGQLVDNLRSVHGVPKD